MSRQEPTVNDVIRVGKISAVYPERGTATVQFPDRGGLVSKELAVSQVNTLKNKDESFPDPGEHVVCAFFGNGLSEGVVLSAIYDAKNKPNAGNPDVRTTKFEDGTTFTVDRKNHVVEIQDSFGSVIKMADGYIDLKPAIKVRITKGG
jgi:phage baseplate assembly protein V